MVVLTKKAGSMKDKQKKLTIVISNECWKKLKIVSIDREITLQQLAEEILDRFKKGKQLEEE